MRQAISSTLICSSLLTVGPFDPLLVAPQWHKVLFEDDTIRVLLTETKPGEKRTIPYAWLSE